MLKVHLQRGKSNFNTKLCLKTNKILFSDTSSGAQELNHRDALSATHQTRIQIKSQNTQIKLVIVTYTQVNFVIKFNFRY